MPPSMPPEFARSRSAAPLHAATLIAFMAASSAPTPLYPLYQTKWMLSPLMLTVVFGAYAFSLLGALLTVGALSDHLGRRPVIVVSLLVQAAAMAAFLGAASLTELIVARLLQGFATGAAATALGAALIDATPKHGPLINGLAPPLGMAGGALGSGTLVAFAPWPLHLVYGLLLATALIQAALARMIPETATRRPGAWASLWPSVRVPRQARATLLRITPANVATWALGGFFLSLMPSLIGQTTGGSPSLNGGLAVAVLTISGAAAILSLRRREGTAILRLGTPMLALGVAVILAGVWRSALPVLFAGAATAGFGWGASFLGSLRTLLPLAGPNQRAGLMAAFYVQSYLAMSVPAILTALAVHTLGLVAATGLYGGALIALALVAFAVTPRPHRVTPPLQSAAVREASKRNGCAG